MELEPLMELAVKASEEANRVIMDVYQSDSFDVEAKGDQSPLTRADRLAHHVIMDRLNSTGLPMLSEEGKSVPYGERRLWDYFWLVDPLDGTKEFINRNGDFTVNIALIHQHQPVLGVVAVPVTGVVYFAAQGLGAFMKQDGKVTQLEKKPKVDLTQEGLRVVASRSHLNKETQDFIAQLKSPEMISRGSSLKFMLLAEGKADVYPRFGPTMEWDTAAAHGIVRELSIQVFQVNSVAELQYNKEDLHNPYFIGA
jgi:3'(2'), 5'-bisphosphate nucleotidase